jgi:mono/diheme cytochrome c family protein
VFSPDLATPPGIATAFRRFFVCHPAASLVSALLISLASATAATAATPTAKLEFNRDVRPILSENCFHCHGQDANHREGRLRLDDAANATVDRGGYAVIVPGQPDESELIARLISTDEEDRMPPTKSNKHLTAEQIETLRRWIAEGAEYQSHWAFSPPRRAALPEVQASAWVRTPIDRFVLARLEREGLSPRPEATPEAWLRRVSFDLVGLPPSPADRATFLADVARRGEAAYGAAVDRLLASPHFGERLALDWLDAARYADSHGFNNDSTRSMWRWRDWVIEAFNRNLPYNTFITEQLAGDLLPSPTLEQRIATGFGRNHVINSEGGIIDEEYRVEYVADRVRTLSTAWLGLTFECARCHDHKFDPISQKDYFSLFAFLNNVPEFGEDGRVANAVPMIPAPTTAQQLALADQERRLAELEAAVSRARASLPHRSPETDRALRSLLAQAQASVGHPGPDLLPARLEAGPPGITGAAWRATATTPLDAVPTVPAEALNFAGKQGLSFSFWLRPDADNPPDVPLLSAMDYSGSKDDTTFGRGGEVRLIEGEIELRLSERYPTYALILRTEKAGLRAGEWRHVTVTYAGGRRASGVRIFVDGRELRTHVFHDGLPAEHGRKPYRLGADNAPNGARWRGALDSLRSVPRALDATEVRQRFLTEALPLALTTVPEGTDADAWRTEGLLLARDQTRHALEARDQVWTEHLALHRAVPTTMVMAELPQPRQAYVLNRGAYDARTEPVSPGVPESLLAPWPAGAPRNRLGLAQWLTQPNHPLTSRVVVNRFWAQLFGTGIVKTLEDFGYQSEWPSHPELLDWLARDFVDGGWDVKALLRGIVLSSTYRQSSSASPEDFARDPDNRLLARGPRLRLPAELLRDQALAVSGLLTPAIGGPSVFPYQPEKLYAGLVVGTDYPGTKWIQSQGPDLHRRSLYTFWKRTVPHPAMLTFDAPDREFCTVRRSRTNTPLQALTLWNETGYVEAARQLGARLLREAGPSDEARVAYGFLLATGREPDATERGVLTRALAQLRTEFTSQPDQARALLAVGDTPADPSLNPAEFAAATTVAGMILNLDETLTKN